ncbi:MAG: HAD family hydrolase [Chloroflexi bacterium]|nr:HAD family hydrolase [Chloroflexota bacterium]
MIRGILFDLGSTLLSFDAPWLAVSSQASEVLLQALQEAGLALGGEFLAQYRCRLEEYYARRATMPDLHSTLGELRRRGYRLGLVSNASDYANVGRLLDKAGIRAYFDPVLVSAAVGVRKPNPHIFELALQAWGLPPAQVVMIGDTLGADILGAHNAGMRGIWVTMQADTPANRAHEDTILPEATAGGLAELPELIERLSRGMRKAE